MMKATLFADMHSGGGRKLDWEVIVIEAPEHLARMYFEKCFERNPDNVTCPCCGNDYFVSEEESVEACSWSGFEKLPPLLVRYPEVKQLLEIP